MKFTVHGAFLLLFSVLQATWLNSVEIFGVKPALFLIYIVIVSCFAEKNESAAVGFVFGLISDILAGRFFGANALLGMITGFTSAYFCERVIRKNNIFLTIGVIACQTIIYETVYYLFSSLVMGNTDLIYAYRSVILIECVYNCIVAFPVCFIFKKLAVRMYADKGEGIGY